MTKTMVRMFSELLSKWKAQGDVALADFFRKENGRSAEKRPRSASGSNSFVENGASPCISLKHLGSPSSESDSQKSTAEGTASKTPSSPAGDGLGENGDQGQADGRPPDHAQDDDGASEDEGPHASEAKNESVEEQHAEELEQGNISEHESADAVDDRIEKAGEGTRAAGQDSQAVDPHDVISQQIAGLRLRKYLRDLLKQVLTDGTAMIKSVVKKEITDETMERQVDPKAMSVRWEYGGEREQLAKPQGDAGAVEMSDDELVVDLDQVRGKVVPDS
ncbi:unnamed protein product [Amoebophrya sp. A25]|nr:unnamed protein product [Amoebophrya sp. A25]|eukprot:GSA25T00021060001.1